MLGQPLPAVQLWCPVQAANLTEEQFTELWQEYVSAAADCLLKANDDPESDAGKRLVRVSPCAGCCSGVTARQQVKPGFGPSILGVGWIGATVLGSIRG